MNILTELSLQNGIEVNSFKSVIKISNLRKFFLIHKHFCMFILLLILSFITVLPNLA